MLYKKVKHTAWFLKYVWPFYNIHESVKQRILLYKMEKWKNFTPITEAKANSSVRVHTKFAIA